MPGRPCTNFGAYADRPRTAWYNATAGNRYRIRASDPGSDWTVRVTEQKPCGDATAIATTCP